MPLETKLIGSVGIDLGQFASDAATIKKSLAEVSKAAKDALQFNLSVSDESLKKFKSEVQRLINDLKKAQGAAGGAAGSPGGAAGQGQSTSGVAQANKLYSEMIDKMR